MIKGKAVSSGSNRVGGVSVAAKQAVMLRLIGEASSLSIVSVSDITPEEKAKLTGNAWELHGKPEAGSSGNYTGSNFAVDTKEGETLALLSKTMLVYFLASCGDRLESSVRETLQTKVIGKLVDAGEQGIRASKFEGGFEKPSVGDKGFEVITNLRAKIVSDAREAARKALEQTTAQEAAKVGPVKPIQHRSK